MKKAHLMGLVAAATLSIAGSAWAGYWSNYVPISMLETAADGYVVYPGAALNNPGGCTNATPAYGYASSTAAEKDAMNKTLLSAFLANRKVKLNIASTVCTPDHNYPVYLSVRVDAAQ
jgi:hypothetical protein